MAKLARIAHLPHLRSATAAAVFGALATLTQGFVSAWYLMIVAVAGLAWLLFHPGRRILRARVGFLLGMAWGLPYFIIGVGWLFISMHRYGEMPAPLAAAGVVALSALLASFGALACALSLKLAKSAWAQAALFAGFWGLTEWTRGWIFTGFPWLALGYSQIDGPLGQLAPLTGVYGMSIVVAALGASLGIVVWRLQQKRWIAAAKVLTAILAAALLTHYSASLLPAFTATSGTPVSVRLVQGNIAQEMKFNPDRARAAMLQYIGQVASSKASLTVLPETAWIIPWERTPNDLAEPLAHALKASNTVLALGIPAIDQGAFFNSVLLVGADQRLQARYDKRHLVPFGEFVPPGFRWFIDQMKIPLGDFGRGSESQRLVQHAGQGVAFNICYEDLFGEELAVQVRQGANILINVSNIAWFGDSHALPQHLAIARLRSLELGRPMLRATNTGVTAHIDHQGKVIARLENHISGSLDTMVTGRTGLTPYARWGNAIALLLALGLLIAGAALRRQN